MGFICSSSLLPAFAHYKMSRIDFSDIVNPGAVPSLNEGQVASIKIAFPSLREQRAIVDFLDTETAKINALIEGKRRLIELLEEKQQAVCARAVSRGLDPAVPLKASDVEWLGDVPAHWKVKRFKEVLREVDDGGVRILSSSTRQGIAANPPPPVQSFSRCSTQLPPDPRKISLVAAIPRKSLRTEELHEGHSKR
jgi:restriction endonuclease S subunit